MSLNSNHMVWIGRRFPHGEKAEGAGNEAG